MRATLFGLALALTLIGCAFAKPAADKPVAAKTLSSVFDHKDWIGLCDNTLRCTAMALAPDERDSRAYLAIVRDGDPAAAPTLKIALYSDANIPSGPVHLHAGSFDADVPGRWADGEILAPSKDAALIAALARLSASEAKTLQLSIGQTSVAISLVGAAATLTWMDDRQGRIGSVTALTKKGPRPLTEMPPAPPLPVYVAAPKGSAVEVKPVVFPQGLLDRPELKDCDKAQLNDADERGAWRVAPDVMLWSVPCTLGAYNLASVFMVSDSHGRALRPAPIPALATPDANDPGADPAYRLINADFDPKTMILNAFEKARGLGDCGALDRFLWDGRTFQPLEIDVMPECRGVTPEAWPALYRGHAK
jgi:hypothetical protein